MVHTEMDLATGTTLQKVSSGQKKINIHKTFKNRKHLDCMKMNCKVTQE